jgi:putative transcriptional regulator
MKNDLRVLRAQKGWSQGDLADALGVSRQSVNALETGKYDPSLPLAFRIARLFGKRVDQIFDDELAASTPPQSNQETSKCCAFSTPPSRRSPSP